MKFNSVSLSSREVPNEEFMPSKRTLFCLKPTRDVRVTGMTCSYPPEVWRPVTIVVVTYKHRGNNPIKDVIHPHDAGIGMPPRPPCEVRTSAWYDVIIQILDGVPHLTQTRGLLVADREPRVEQVSASKSVITD
jgi:hypothetical protein